jgi:Undecaprenyl-phosphate galactose phosphotransferase WbaP
VLDAGRRDPSAPSGIESGWAPYLAQELGISHAVVAVTGLSHESRSKLLARYSAFFDHVFAVSEDAGLPALWTAACGDSGFRGHRVRNAASKPGERALKRAIDVVGASLALLLLSPLFGVLSLLIWAGSTGPVFYRQERMGAGGEPFDVLKFRSMYSDAESRLDEVLEENPERRKEYETYHKLSDDPRVTPVGKFLRRYSLDELPQLLNVLWGDMSLVGPRAYMPAERSKMKELDPVVLKCAPGVTGLWQVSGRNNLSFEERVDLDVHYVQNWSLALDFYLLARTVPVVLSGEGAS